MSGIAAVAILLGLTSLTTTDKKLKTDDPAPELVLQEFIKGEAVKKFEKGKIYVVEFWSTTCLPCLLCIPHLTKLQKKYSDITFIGVVVSESSTRKVKAFVKKMGKEMDCRVALDAVPEGKESDDGVMTKSWLTAADRGIPTAFIVDGSGKIAWIGDPSDEALEVLLGKVRSSSLKRKGNHNPVP